MQPSLTLIAVLILNVDLSTNLQIRKERSDNSDWSYSGDNGPQYWGGECNVGQVQSPVNFEMKLAQPISGHRIRLGDAYNRDVRWTISWDGHANQATMKDKAQMATLEGGSLGGSFIFKSLHMHFGAEHTVSGLRHLAEVHLVHYNAKYSPDEAGLMKDGLAVVGFFIIEDEDASDELTELIGALARGKPKPGSAPFEGKFCLGCLLPRRIEPWIRYEGSLTTPPCSESVIWTVVLDPIKVRPGLYLPLNTYRPTQALNNRTLYMQHAKHSLLFARGGAELHYNSVTLSSLILFALAFFSMQ